MNQITTFWNHFLQNHFVFLLLNKIHQDELKSHFNKLLLCLHRYYKDLNIIIKYKKQIAELIITANGNPYLFKEVELLVHHAPVVEHWKITAFLQPEMNTEKYENGNDKPLDLYAISLQISEMYFQAFDITDKPTDLGTRVFIKNYIVHKDNPRLREVVYTQIEHLLGEKSFANDITCIEIGQLEYDNSYLIELLKLNEFISKFI